MMDMMELGRRIRQRRENRKLRQADVSDALQVSFQAVSKWERGENAPDIALLPRLARLLDVTVDWLLSGDEAGLDTIEATVLCTGMAGFAARARELAPRELATWMNGIFYSLTEAIRHEGGVPVKYVGDGCLAFFSGGHHADRAVRAACFARRALPGKELLFSVHSGSVFLGAMGHPDYASPDILGDTVNNAFLLLPWLEAKGTAHLAITETTRALLADVPACSPLKAVFEKGETRLQIFTVADSPGAGSGKMRRTS